MLRTVTRASVLAILAVGAYATGVGCSGSGPEPSTSSEPGKGDTTGTIGLALQTGGITVTTFGYVIQGPNGFAKAGNIDVSASPKVAAVIGGIPAGTGFTITLTGTATDNTTQCLGSAPFAVTAGATTSVNVAIDCHQAPKTGSVSVSGTINVCPSIQSLSASPSVVLAGSSVSLTSAAADPDNGPSPLTFQWTSTSGTFSSATDPNPTFTCTTAGVATVTLTVSDGDPLASCAATSTVQMTCSGHVDAAAETATATKVKHVVVIFGENISFDHYFGTYPIAANNAGDAPFSAAVSTPVANNLATPLDTTHGFTPVAGVDLLNHNPNLANAGNGAGAANPFRLAAAQASTNDQGHNYKPEQQASDNGAMDLFPEFTGTAGPPPGAPPAATTKGLVMAYFDGNTVSTMWNLAQSYALNDNSWTTTFGPSTPGAINLISGQTNGFGATNKALNTFSTSHVVADGNGGFTLIGDTDPLGDVCSTSTEQNTFLGKNVGDLLNAKGITWGFFEGGFDLGVTNANGTTGCNRSTPQTVPNAASISADYIPHHQPFQFYPSTANLTHARPSSVSAIGKSVEADGVTPEPANHQYDTHDFFDALSAGNLPSVVYLKAPAFQDGHAGYSNPVDEGNFVASVVAALQASQEWSSTVIVQAYDDSDGWYDHQSPPIVNVSSGAADALNGVGLCNSGAQQNWRRPDHAPLLGNDGHPALGRCGYGTRMPLLVISPYAKQNFIDHTLTDQTSILRFVEDNWLSGQRVQPGGSFDTIAGAIENMLNL